MLYKHLHKEHIPHTHATINGAKPLTPLQMSLACEPPLLSPCLKVGQLSDQSMKIGRDRGAGEDFGVRALDGVGAGCVWGHFLPQAAKLGSPTVSPFIITPSSLTHHYKNTTLKQSLLNVLTRMLHLYYIAS